MRRQFLTLAAALVAILAFAGTSYAQPNPYFQLGFKLLADQIPGIAGEPVEDEHFNPANGDSLQQTTKGLMVWRKADNWTAFTDGASSWINGPFGVQQRSNDTRFDWEAPGPKLGLALLDQGAGFDAGAEQAALDMINQSRRQYGVPPVAMDEALRQIARSRARDMSVRNYFAHVNPDGKSAFDLMAAAGIGFTAAAENIGWGVGYGSPTNSVRNNHNEMMAETPPNDSHRRDILNGSLHKVGIGVYTGSDGKTIYASDFTD